MKKENKKSGKTPVKTKSINPATLKPLSPVENTDMTKMKEYFERGRRAQEEWQSYSFKKRKAHLLKMADYIADNAEAISEVVSQVSGKTRIDALATEVIPCIISAKWYGKNAKRALVPKKLASSSVLFINKRNVIERIPLGIVGIISPWNYPLSIPLGEVFMALMAGNGVMLKVATPSVLVGKEIEKIVNAGGLPSGLFHLITASGNETAQAFFKNGSRVL